MRTLPRHLVLAAVVLTVCCAQRQATSSVDPSRLAEVSGQRLDDSRLVHQNLRQRRSQHRLIRPAAIAGSVRASEAFAPHALPAVVAPATPVVHAIYPPNRFRLPPPAILV